ncbi:MAG: hypothetical protein IJ329_00080 [Clostridia bacterium]|nr:hypothetical protein [Clostridia bacterium]
MDRQTQTNDVFTKANEDAEKGVFLTSKDAEEFRAYKRRKRMTEVALAIARSEGSLFCGEDVQRVCERAVRLQQAAIKMPLSKLAQAKGYLAGSFVRMDCVVGGNGETLAKVKAFEARTAVKKGAKEITVPVTPSLFDGCRYAEIRKELKRVKRAIGKTALKVRVEKISSPTALSRLARISSEVGAKYFSVPYFAGCERLRLDLTGGCFLETTGVERLETYRALTEKGVERIATDNAWEIYNDWMREAQETPLVSSEAEKEENGVGDNLPPCVSAAKILALAEKEKTEKEENGNTDDKNAGKKQDMEIRLL